MVKINKTTPIHTLFYLNTKLLFMLAIRRHTQGQLEKYNKRHEEKPKEDENKPKYIEQKAPIRAKWVSPVNDIYVSMPEPLKPNEDYQKRKLSEAAKKRKSTIKEKDMFNKNGLLYDL